MSERLTGTTVRTQADLDLLPRATIVRDSAGYPIIRDRTGRWYVLHDNGDYGKWMDPEDMLPAVVIHVTGEDPLPDLVPDADPSNAALLAEQYDDTADRLVRDLRSLADKIDASTFQLKPGSSDYLAHAAQVVADVSNALPSLGLSALVRAARDVHTARTFDA